MGTRIFVERCFTVMFPSTLNVSFYVYLANSVASAASSDGNVHRESTLHSKLFTFYIVFSSLHCLHFTLRTLRSTHRTPQSPLHTLDITFPTPHPTLHPIPRSTVYSGTVTGEGRTKLLGQIVHRRGLRDCIRVRWFLLFTSSYPVVNIEKGRVASRFE